MDEVKAFPRTAEEALAMLYVTKTIPVTATPEEYMQHYKAALARIKAEADRMGSEQYCGGQAATY